MDYGRYDWRRLLNTIQVIEMPPTGGEPRVDLRIGVAEGGFHAAEQLVLARYYMFTQVYFHKTRVAYDYHIKEALKVMLGGMFPPPIPKEAGKSGIQDYLEWDDSRCWENWPRATAVNTASGWQSGTTIAKCIIPPEFATDDHREILRAIRNTLGDLIVYEAESSTSAYKLQLPDISVVSEDGLKRVKALSDMSLVVKSLTQKPLLVVRLYSKPELADTARTKIENLRK